MCKKILILFLLSGVVWFAGTSVLSGDDKKSEELVTPLDKQIADFAAAVEKINSANAKSKKPVPEEKLRGNIPKEFRDIEDVAAKIADDEQAAKALYDIGLIYAELACVQNIDKCLHALEKRSSETAAKLGRFRLSTNYLFRFIGCDAKYLDCATQLFECYIKGYAEIFGITNISKVSGKKIRVTFTCDPGLKVRLYFHPTPMWHSECRFNFPEEKYLTKDGGCRLITGFAHELGHMVAMWGRWSKNPEHSREDDFHAWGPYCGCLLSDYVYEKLGRKAWPDYIPDYRRTDGTQFMESFTGEKPSCADKKGCVKLFKEIGDKLGTQIYGKAFAWMEEYKKRTINNCPYYWLKDLKDALNAITKKKYSKWLDQIFADMYNPEK